MRMANPCHPGELILEALDGVTVSEASKSMGISSAYLSSVISGHASVTPDMADRLSQYFGTSSNMWLNLQRNYDEAPIRNQKVLVLSEPEFKSVEELLKSEMDDEERQGRERLEKVSKQFGFE